MHDNQCPECIIGEIVMYTKPDGNYFCCNNCPYSINLSYSTGDKK